MNRVEHGPLDPRQAADMLQHEQAGPNVGASHEINTEASPDRYPEPQEVNGECTFLSALYCAEHPDWDGCIGESVARALAKNYRGIEERLRTVFEISRKHECFVPSRHAERWILTGKFGF